MIPSEAPENFTQVNFLSKIIGIQMHFIFLYNSFVYFDFRPLVMILPINITRKLKLSGRN